MARPIRTDVGNEAYHAIWRANNREKIFYTVKDYLLFEDLLVKAVDKFKIGILAYICMPNHIHFSFFPSQDKQIRKFMHWFGTAFTHKYRISHKNIGNGHIFQDRYKLIIVENGKTLLNLLLYIERNSLRAGLVEKAEDWRWSSAWIRKNGTKRQKSILCKWPIEMPKNYYEILNNKEETEDEIRSAIRHNIPLGSEEWKKEIKEKYRVIVKIPKTGRPFKINGARPH